MIPHSKQLQSRMLSKALITQIATRGYIGAFEIQGINDFYRRELEAEYNSIILPPGATANDMDAWFKLWGPQLLLFKRAIEVISGQYEILVIRYLDPFLLNLLEQITSAHKTRKLRVVHLYNVLAPCAPPIFLYPGDNVHPQPPMPAIESAPVECNAENFKVTLPGTEDSCLVSMAAYIPNVEDEAFFNSIEQLDAAPQNLRRSSSESTATTQASNSNRSSPDASPFSGSPPCSPRNEEFRELDRLEIRVAISLKRCQMSLQNYKARALTAHDYHARVLLLRKIPTRFYDLEYLNEKQAMTVPLRLDSHNYDEIVCRIKQTLRQSYHLKLMAYGTFLQDRNMLATAIRFYNQEYANIYGNKPPKANLLSSQSIFAYKPNSVNTSYRVKRPEHYDAVESRGPR